MNSGDSLLAWVEPYGFDAFMAAFIGEGAAGPPGGPSDLPRRAPATQLCSSLNEARQWVEAEAAALGIPVKWISATRSGNYMDRDDRAPTDLHSASELSRG